jgi:glycine/D-amino acid oxidase-like deaminating enzyme
MTKLRTAVPVWLGSGRQTERQRYPSLNRRIDVDAVIVGGGIVGAAAAHTFARAGVRVALLESQLVGHGSTAASTALLMQEPDEGLQELTKRYGATAARRIWELSRAATREFVATLRRARVACELADRDSVYYTLEPAKVRSLRAEHERRRAAGFGGRWLDAAALRRATGISGAGGIRTTGNAQLDPYRACLGLLSSAQEHGAHIFEHSTVRRIRKTSIGVIVYTRDGSITARRAIIATGYATAAFRPLAGRFRMTQTYVLATEPIGARVRRELGLGDVMLWDTKRSYHYARWTSDRRLLLGGGDRPLMPPKQRVRAFTDGRRVVRQYFESLFPALADVEIACAWEGLFAITRDGLPFIGPHRRYPHQLFALGYGGNGMTFGFLAARMLLEHFNDERSADHRLFAFDRFD